MRAGAHTHGVSKIIIQPVLRPFKSLLFTRAFRDEVFSGRREVQMDSVVVRVHESQLPGDEGVPVTRLSNINVISQSPLGHDVAPPEWHLPVWDPWALVKAGYAVAGFDPSEQARKSFEANGGFAVDSLEELCKGNSSHYFIIVARAGQVDSVIFGTDRLVSHLPRNTAICLCCTLPPIYVVDLPGRLKNCGREDLRLVNCPVSGGAIGALKVMMAGDEPVIEKLKPEAQDDGPHQIDSSTTGIVNDCADEVSFACPLASEAFSVFVKTTALGFGRRDDAFVVDNSEEITKKQVAEQGQEHPALQNGGGPAVGYFARPGPHPQGGENTRKPQRRATERCAGSIVVVTGLSDKQQVVTFKKEIKDQHSQIQFLNGQIVPGQECTTVPQASDTGPCLYYQQRLNNNNFAQLLFISDSADTLVCVQKALPSSIARHCITGSFESATLMSLTIRYGPIIHIAAAAESYALAVAMGIPPAFVYKLVAGAAGSSTQVNTKFPFMINRVFDISTQDTTELWNEPSLQCTAADSKMLPALTPSLMFPATLLNAAHQRIKDANPGGSK
ncbi:hypothetical protein PISL3812_09658 [Talaromyces islandicus]|uniref:6-phosphogluconate dehydrogenase NADP-binding domain-containing protein n=1 Tax=Talaromyces islandicus TaxID=28573 RepID=A0A0U1MCC5_TALIS|nr:hypothetical protein PISL3812_09658 [Talaromyces islandicus]